MMQQHVHAKKKKKQQKIKLHNKNTGNKCLIKVIKSKTLERYYENIICQITVHFV